MPHSEFPERIVPVAILWENPYVPSLAGLWELDSQGLHDGELVGDDRNARPFVSLWVLIGS
jgi:hypothetical protein